MAIATRLAPSVHRMRVLPTRHQDPHCRILAATKGMRSVRPWGER
ncbi:hypothetical protein OG410_41670 [Streptomyces sp. NBC_00659]|nr:hypothetical protein [Streptomyces sp. NBC_00659]